MAGLLKLFGLAPRVAIAADAVSRAFRGEDDAGDNMGGLGPLAPSTLDQDRAREEAIAEDERVRANRQYLGLRDDYFKRRVGARDANGHVSTVAESLVLRSKFDQMPDVTRSESDARLDASGAVPMPHRSVSAARASTLEIAADDGDADDWFRDPTTRDPIHASEKRRT